jgi:26S proteasome regulatory subunit N11
MGDRLQQLLRGMGGAGGGGGMGGKEASIDPDLADTSETIQLSSLALIKMLKHGRAGVPMEVMGLMLGTFVDEYTVKVVDVFAMPQSGTGTAVEAVDPVFQQKFMDLLKIVNRPESVVGWYHSHPGFGCWLSSTDCNTQQSFEKLTARAVALVIDPIQSVKGKVVIDAFRLINQQTLMMGQAPRQTTSNVGHLRKPPIAALIHNLNRHYYSLNIDYRKNEFEQKMLVNLHKKIWSKALKLDDAEEHRQKNEKGVEQLLSFAKSYKQRLDEEETKTAEELLVANVGKPDPKRHLESVAEELLTSNITACLGSMLATVVF